MSKPDFVYVTISETGDAPTIPPAALGIEGVM
jgi:hypothetical protein